MKKPLVKVAKKVSMRCIDSAIFPVPIKRVSSLGIPSSNRIQVALLQHLEILIRPDANQTRNLDRATAVPGEKADFASFLNVFNVSGMSEADLEMSAPRKMSEEMSDSLSRLTLAPFDACPQ